MSALILLLVAVCIIATIRYLLVNTTTGFCLRHGIDEHKLYVEAPVQSGPDNIATVYERRIRRCEIYGSTRLTGFGIPLDIEEFRRITAIPDRGYLSIVSDWFKNTHECRRDGVLVREPLFDFRPMTETERQTYLPQLLKESLRCEQQMATSRKSAMA